MNNTLTLLVIFSNVITMLTIHTYERLLARTRAERDESLADADLATDLFMAARERHPSGTNVRVLRVVE